MRCVVFLTLLACGPQISYSDPDHQLGVWHDAVEQAGALYVRTQAEGMTKPIHFVDTGTPHSRIAKVCDDQEATLFDGVRFRNVACAGGTGEPVIGNDIIGLFSFWFELNADTTRYALNLKEPPP